MRSEFWEAFGVFLTGLFTVALAAVVLSRNANTAAVAQTGFSGIGNTLAVAEAPVTGASTPIDLSYPSSSGLGFGSSSLGFGPIG
jgi:hypothetical protein